MQKNAILIAGGVRCRYVTICNKFCFSSFGFLFRDQPYIFKHSHDGVRAESGPRSGRFNPVHTAMFASPVQCCELLFDLLLFTLVDPYSSIIEAIESIARSLRVLDCV